MKVFIKKILQHSLSSTSVITNHPPLTFNFMVGSRSGRSRPHTDDEFDKIFFHFLIFPISVFGCVSRGWCPYQVTKGDPAESDCVSPPGGSQVDLSTLVPLTLLYCLFLVIGVLGNLATCLVICCNHYMRSPLAGLDC